ncbi:transmembrane protein 98 isoform X2 [Leptinotarsa decemlineata]|uniref:transmembrane protein 98 isoform X2 n=1 Tax=Leptinotarsa decemlineata TaxID=7539 RepID=UPI000C2531D2|nr:transmembrane protein 98-like isoform X2 [Leptinotarsa decemlineata]
MNGFATKMNPEYAEMVAAIAFGVLSAIFVSAFIILVVICRRQRLFYKASYLDSHHEFSKPEKQLIEPDRPELELGEVSMNFEEILTDEQWIDDATGLIPHCLAILKTCRYLTERLTALAMNSTPISGNFRQIVESAKRISSRVDDMVRSMYPPLDPRLLEARAAALTLAVTHLALIAKYECGQKERGGLVWIDQSLEDMDSHMIFLKEASLSQETINKLTNAYNLSTTL